MGDGGAPVWAGRCLRHVAAAAPLPCDEVEDRVSGLPSHVQVLHGPWKTCSYRQADKRVHIIILPPASLLAVLCCAVLCCCRSVATSSAASPISCSASAARPRSFESLILSLLRDRWLSHALLHFHVTTHSFIMWPGRMKSTGQFTVQLPGNCCMGFPLSRILLRAFIPLLALQQNAGHDLLLEAAGRTWLSGSVVSIALC